MVPMPFDRPSGPVSTSAADDVAAGAEDVLEVLPAGVIRQVVNYDLPAPVRAEAASTATATTTASAASAVIHAVASKVEARASKTASAVPSAATSKPTAAAKATSAATKAASASASAAAKAASAAAKAASAAAKAAAARKAAISAAKATATVPTAPSFSVCADKDLPTVEDAVVEGLDSICCLIGGLIFDDSAAGRPSGAFSEHLGMHYISGLPHVILKTLPSRVPG
eukprot:CAMPEP_0198737702 /NCGR_PEP_ID=MMETSP1475-20131203/68002_1 /TAXON_ID= ORGANISM="Unidentified sp., Strain CCMP1999" /NCGR_SAMPLE_ID=MMETSP1475 /ASSEMBLY_ACC=CAM_ASM_001111 /LENGTH=226 /DNA_ID=CAMNT_0044501571 /DNA_START=167 /DNA_END=846 /DNA_ORIENTATION=-